MTDSDSSQRPAGATPADEPDIEMEPPWNDGEETPC